LNFQVTVNNIRVASIIYTRVVYVYGPRRRVFTRFGATFPGLLSRYTNARFRPFIVGFFDISERIRRESDVLGIEWHDSDEANAKYANRVHRFVRTNIETLLRSCSTPESLFTRLPLKDVRVQRVIYFRRKLSAGLRRFRRRGTFAVFPTGQHAIKPRQKVVGQFRRPSSARRRLCLRRRALASPLDGR